MEHSRDCDTIREVYGKSKFADFPLNVNNNWQKTAVRITNTTQSSFLMKKNTHIAEFSVVTPEQSKDIKPVDTAILSMIPQGDPDLTAYLNKFLRTNKTRAAKQHLRLPKTWKFWKAWGSNPNTDTNPQRIDWTQRRRRTQSTRGHRISKQISQTIWLDWHTSNRNRKTSNLEYPGRPSWHFLQTQNGYWGEHGIQGETNPDSRQSCKQPKSTNADPFAHIKEDLIVELALMHKYGMVTVLPFSKYASPIFAQWMPNGKLRLQLDLRKINSLIADDYTDNKHPVCTLSDAAQHLAGKSLFCKLDSSQAYHCLQMVDQRSVEMLAFNFGSGTFAYERLAQGLSRFVSAFSSSMRQYMDPAFKDDQCAQ